MTEHTTRSRMLDPEAIHSYILGGCGRLTLLSARSGNRFTYRFRRPKSPSPNKPVPIFVSVLSGADNEGSYTYLGCLWEAGDGRLEYRHGRKSHVGEDAPSAKAFAWALRWISAGEMPGNMHVWHEGVCGRCGRSLTVPESIESGLGPICRRKAA